MAVKTSRIDILDKVEVVTNLIAMCSHTQELISYYLKEIEGGDNKDENLNKLLNLREITAKATELRREYMLTIQGDDDKMWCILKHAIAAYGYASELYIMNLTEDYEYFAHLSYENLIRVLSMYLGLEELETCGRCLLDKIK